jgi:hypothetical protein
VNDSDRALGAFSLFTMLAYLMLAAVLGWFSAEITGTAVVETADEEQRMMDSSNTSSENKEHNSSSQNKNGASSNYSTEGHDEADVVDIDLEETETF